ncbi:MAG TPA: CHAT domain-containing protein, partial [Planctomycetota bacterium]|nr:CHAT domain-containing protein [Planctomycetota bacterium]
DLEHEAEDLERAFRARHPLAGSVRGFEPVPLGEFQASLAPGVVALDYLVGEREVFALVVWREGARVVRVGSARLLREACRTVGALLRDATVGTATLLDAARGLSARLLAGPLDGIDGIRRLVVLPDGALHSVAFEALPFGPGHLIESVEVAYVPCASAFLALRRGPLDPDALRFLGVAVTEGWAAGDGAPAGSAPLRAGLGPLPRAEEEVRAAAALVGGEPTLLLGREATPKALEALDLRSFGLLHFAAHGVPDEETPGRSGLLLHDAADPSSRAVLEARAISNLTLRADLAVLSACRTGGGKLQAGEGVRSLARSFLEAGSRSVLLTLWEVSDPVCLAFMDLFYGALRDGASKGEALRRAKIESLRAGGSRAGLRNASAWAGFVLVGDAEGRIPLSGTRPGGGVAPVWLALAGLV